MKIPLKYKNQVVGYLDSLVVLNNVIDNASFYLFETDYTDEIIKNICKSIGATFDKDIKSLNDNNIYDFTLKNNLLTLNRK